MSNKHVRGGENLGRGWFAMAVPSLIFAVCLWLASCGSEDNQGKKTDSPNPAPEANSTHPKGAIVTLEPTPRPLALPPGPTRGTHFAASLRVDRLLSRADQPDSLLGLVRTMGIEVPEILAGLLREPTKLGVDLAQPVHFFVEEASDANAGPGRFLCASASIADPSALTGQVDFFALLGMKKVKEGNLTLCHFAESSLAFAFDEKHFALALALNDHSGPKNAIVHTKSMFANRPPPSSILVAHVAQSFDLGFYLHPKGKDLAPAFLSQGIARRFPSAVSTTKIDFQAGNVIARFNSFPTDANGTLDRAIENPAGTLPTLPSGAIASFALSYDDNSSPALANFAFHDLLHSMWSAPFTFPEDNATALEEGLLTATWKSSSKGLANGAFVAEISIPGHQQGKSAAIESSAWTVANPQLNGIRFAAEVACFKAVGSLRSVPEPEAWRYDLVDALEKLERLSWSGTLMESTLKVAWRDKEKNGLASLLDLIRKWHDERDGVELYSAIADGDFAALKQAMENASPHLLDPGRNASPLHFAAWKGQVEILAYFLEKGMGVDARDVSGRTPLHAACWSGNKEAIQALLEQNASVDSPNSYGATPAMTAARIGHADIVEILIQAGADANATDQHGHGLLEYAAAGGRDEVIGLLRDHNATVRRPLHLAAGTGNLKEMTLLLASGMEVDEKDGWGGTALLFAASAGKPESLDFLLEKGADSKVTDKLGLTLVHAAAASGNEKVLQHVLALMPEINPRHKQHGSTPLDWAIGKKDRFLIQMLRAKGGKTSWELGAP